MEPQKQPPLWQVMQDALLDSTGTCESSLLGEVIELPSGSDWSGVIRAVRDYLINNTVISQDAMDLLAAEIQRAEAGE